MRTKVIKMRVSPTERRILDRAAKRDDLRLSTWARHLLLRGARHQGDALPAESPRIRHMEIKGRLRHWKAVLWGPLLKILGSLYAILGLASLVRGEFFPDKGGPLIGFIPAWTSATWLALGLTLIVIVTLEGSYRVVSAMTRGADRQIEELTALRANGVRLYAAQVKDGTALGAWVARRQEWERLLFPLLGSRFGPATRNRVEYLGALPGAAFEHAYDSNHNHELMILSRRLELLDEILREAK